MAFPSCESGQKPCINVKRPGDLKRAGQLSEGRSYVAAIRRQLLWPGDIAASSAATVSRHTQLRGVERAESAAAGEDGEGRRLAWMIVPQKLWAKLNFRNPNLGNNLLQDREVKHYCPGLCSANFSVTVSSTVRNGPSNLLKLNFVRAGEIRAACLRHGSLVGIVDSVSRAAMCLVSIATNQPTNRPTQSTNQPTNQQTRNCREQQKGASCLYSQQAGSANLCASARDSAKYFCKALLRGSAKQVLYFGSLREVLRRVVRSASAK